MRAAGAGGFTLVEVLVSVGITGVVAAAVFLLLDSGIAAHERGSELSADLAGLSETATLLRADVSRSSEIDYAGLDSLHLSLPGGTEIRWAVRDFGSERRLYRSIDDGSGWTESPMRPLAVLQAGHGVTPGVDFMEMAKGRLEAVVHSHGDFYRVSGAQWRDP